MWAVAERMQTIAKLNRAPGLLKAKLTFTEAKGIAAMVRTMPPRDASIGQTPRRALHWPWSANLILLAVAVFVTAYGCIELPNHVGPVTPIWLANSIVLATLLCSREKRWPMIAGVGALADLAANFATGYNPMLSFGLAASNSVGVTLAALA